MSLFIYSCMGSWTCIRILWVRIQYYFDLCFCSTCSHLGHGELFWVDPCAFLICPYPFFLLSSFLSCLLRVGFLPLCEYNARPHRGLEISPSASERGLRVSDGQELHFTSKCPALRLGQGHKHAQKWELFWFLCPFSPLSSPFLGH